MYRDYSAAEKHQFYDLKRNRAYDAFTGSILTDFAKYENDKWKRYQERSTPPCCGYDVASFIDGTAWKINMMNAAFCSKPFYSFNDVGVPISSTGDDAADDAFNSKQRSVVDMLELTLALSDSMMLGTTLQTICVPAKDNDRTKQWYCPMNIAYNASFVDPSCTPECLSAIRAQYVDGSAVSFDSTTEAALVAIENKLMCKSSIYATARKFALAVSATAFFLSFLQFAALICALRIALWYWDQGDIVIEDDDFDDDSDDESLDPGSFGNPRTPVAMPPKY